MDIIYEEDVRNWIDEIFEKSFGEDTHHYLRNYYKGLIGCVPLIEVICIVNDCVSAIVNTRTTTLRKEAF